MSMKRCPDLFSGKISEFIQQFEKDLILNATQMRQAHDQVVAAVDSSLFIVRSFSKQNKAGELYESSCGTQKYTVGDNEPVVWFWRQIHSGLPVNLNQVILNQTLPISMAPGKGEDKKKWSCWGSGDDSKSQSRWRGYEGGRWKLCHIHQASPKHLNSTKAELIARFVRNFHPMNHFWFASEYIWKTGHFEMTPARLGEIKDVCLAFWNYYCKKFPYEAEWFRKYALLSSSELVPLNPDPEVKFKWIGGTREIPVVPLKINEGSVLTIQENGAGKFHIENMGRTIGGIDRKQPFSIIVKNGAGNILASTGPITAELIGLAKRGLEDYNRDCYHYSYFLKYDEDFRPIPNCEMAEKIKSWSYVE